MTTWILVFYVSFGATGGPAIIDGIATAAECKRVMSEVARIDGVHSNAMRCLKVQTGLVTPNGEVKAAPLRGVEP